MAVTNIYAALRRIPIGNAPPAEKVEFNALGGTSPDFWLSGGYYGVDVMDDAFGTVTLTKRGPDDSTYLTIGASTTFTSNGSAVVLLGPGHYQLTVS